jgi:hypothetical protein
MHHAHADKIPGPRKLHRIFNLIGTVKIVVGDEVVIGRSMIEPKNTFKLSPESFFTTSRVLCIGKSFKFLSPLCSEVGTLNRKINHWLR